MCFFRKKPKQPVERIISKYSYGDQVRFRYKGEICPGIVYGVAKNAKNEIIYTIQIGGECPAIIGDVKEENVIPYKKPVY